AWSSHRLRCPPARRPPGSTAGPVPRLEGARQPPWGYRTDSLLQSRIPVQCTLSPFGTGLMGPKVLLAVLDKVGCPDQNAKYGASQMAPETAGRGRMTVKHR